jgi:K+-sensing histidine kinase KdpD
MKVADGKLVAARKIRHAVCRFLEHLAAWDGSGPAETDTARRLPEGAPSRGGVRQRLGWLAGRHAGPTRPAPLPPMSAPEELPGHPADRHPAIGRLHIYLGAAPGVGKTAAMLRDGLALRDRGAEVAIGWIRPGGDARIHALVELLADRAGMDTAPADSPVADGPDLQGLLARRPDWVLIEDAAAANPAGAAHRHRWQDIEQLRTAGMGVATTLNVGDLAGTEPGAAAAIAAPRGVPEAWFLTAERVTLVDRSAEELAERQREAAAAAGPAAAEESPGLASLEKLRVLALRKTVEHAGAASALADAAAQESGAPARSLGAEAAPRHAYVWSLAVTAGATAISGALFHQQEPTSHLMVYLVGVLVLAARFGFWPSAFAALLSVLASDFLLFPPYFSFAVARPQDLATLGVFLLAALVASRLTANLRSQREQARRRERRIRFLYDLTRALAEARSIEDVGAAAARQFSRDMAWHCEVVAADAAGRLGSLRSDAIDGEPGFEAELARRAYAQQRELVRGTSLGTVRREWYLPFGTANRPGGVLMLRPASASPAFGPEQRSLVGMVAAQIGQAIERIRLGEEARAATVLAETETLRNSLLSAIAHDFRTPLASIVAASGNLLQEGPPLSPQQSRDLAQTISEQARHMEQLAENTLEMARLESGVVRLKREWYPAEEIVGAALSSLEDALASRPVETRMPPGMALVHADAVMIVRVLRNLLENAIKFTPPGSRIEIGAEEQPGRIRFRVADQGPGLRSGDEMRVFDKFFRGGSPQAAPGVGLGLTICRIIVEAHGGWILARNRPTGGAEFSFTIPHAEPMPRLPEET